MPAPSSHSARARSTAPQPLQGCRLGLVCGSGESDCAQLFLDVAQAMGAEVALLRTTDVVMTSDAQTDKLGHLLAQLYDAIECQDLPALVVRRLAQAASIPVFDNLAGAQGAIPSGRETDVDGEGAVASPRESALDEVDNVARRSERLRLALLRALARSDTA
ncbi:hypothetical protein [Roseateles amylovorans]|uniref:Uncharacterized protein n=1 Tax=Roseateles amylovorans TaxID=2978473 RepID=A0ABY6AVA7_9BURK|nr:hypothetical protein [Roseateles amylovorans]UXH76243.1 hypothetical protein N4261_14315 [Roseateles amylovorans]